MSGPRIVTLTVNPAVDVAAEAAEVRPVHKIRISGTIRAEGASTWPGWSTSLAATLWPCSRAAA